MIAKVTVEFTIKNICNKLDLLEAEMTFEEMVKYEVENEGLFSIVDNDGKIIKVEEQK